MDGSDSCAIWSDRSEDKSGGTGARHTAMLIIVASQTSPSISPSNKKYV